MYKIATAFTTVLLATAAHAADTNNFRILGFSKDNKIVAFADTVVQDGSGYGRAEVSVVDIAANKLLLHTEGSDDSEVNGSEKKALDQALAKANLSSYGIELGKITGTTLLNRLPTDLGKDVVFGAQPYADWGTYYSTQYELKIAKKSVGFIPACIEKETKASIMTLSLKSKGKAPKPINLVLQADTRVPASRGCPLDYRVSRVIRNGKALVVVVNYSTPGFEGADKQHIIVTSDKADFND